MITKSFCSHIIRTICLKIGINTLTDQKSTFTRS